MIMRKVLFSIIFICMVCINLYSQEHNYRDKGYKGSISYTNKILIWNGFDTSHGYMFNERHYLGGGLGCYLGMYGNSGIPIIMRIYADYHAYWYDRTSTPVAGIKLGYARSINQNEALSEMEIEPNIGWSWGTKSGFGLTLSFGLIISNTPVHFSESSSLPFSLAPSLSFAFEF